MSRLRIEALIERILRHAAEGHAFLLTCALLSFAGTVTAIYPVTAVVVPATLLAARRWRAIACFSACGSALGATILIAVFHHLGWTQIYAHFPEIAGNEGWMRFMGWATRFGIWAVFLIAVSPLPQTPAFIVLGIADFNYAGVLLATLLGKLIKYGAFAWAASHFPGRVKGSWERLVGRINGAPPRQP